jgi:hypothetical protein
VPLGGRKLCVPELVSRRLYTESVPDNGASGAAEAVRRYPPKVFMLGKGFP